MNHPHHKAVTNQLRRMTDLVKEQQPMEDIKPIAYMCSVGCGCLWRDNGDSTMSLFNANQISCKHPEGCEWMPLSKLIPLYAHLVKEEPNQRIAELEKQLLEAQAQVEVMQQALKPAYMFYMIEVERIGWFAGKKCGQLAFTQHAEEALTFYDKHSAEIILEDYFGSAKSYYHPTTYGRVFVTEHAWMNGPTTLTPSEALQQYGNEQRALALETAFLRIAKYGNKFDMQQELALMAQEWRAKK